MVLTFCHRLNEASRQRRRWRYDGVGEIWAKNFGEVASSSWGGPVFRVDPPRGCGSIEWVRRRWIAVGRRPAQGRRSTAGSLRVGVGPRRVGVLPNRLAAVAEAAARGSEAVAACSVVGRVMAREGADLGEALDELRSITEQAAGRSPTFQETRALGIAWAEETTAYVHQLSCEDPLSGLASAAHLRTRLAEVYRGAALTDVDPAKAFAIVVVEIPSRAEDPFGHALWTVRVVEVVRRTFPGDESIARIGVDRFGVLTVREPNLGIRLAGLRLDLEDLIGGGTGTGLVTVWLEGLPPGESGAARVLDDLLRR